MTRCLSTAMAMMVSEDMYTDTQGRHFTSLQHNTALDKVYAAPIYITYMSSLAWFWPVLNAECRRKWDFVQPTIFSIHQYRTAVHQGRAVRQWAQAAMVREASPFTTSWPCQGWYMRSPPRSRIWFHELSLFKFFWWLQTSLLSFFLVQMS